jgi:DNA modification methylase
MYNEVNYLGTSEWVEFTKTISEVNYPLDHTWVLRRQCKGTISPFVYRDIIEFFTQGGDTILDPYANCGESLLASAMCGRIGIGIEKEKKKCEIFEDIRSKYGVNFGKIVEKENATVQNKLLENVKLTCEEPRRYLEVYKKNYFDFIVTNFTNVPIHIEDEFEEFKLNAKKSFKELYRVLDEGKYLAFFTCDRFINGKYIMPSLLFIEMFEKQGFVFKGKKIYYNRSKNKNSKAYGVGQRYVPNIEHEELIIMQKEG